MDTNAPITFQSLTEEEQEDLQETILDRIEGCGVDRLLAADEYNWDRLAKRYKAGDFS